MKSMKGVWRCACAAGVLLAVGCATHERDALYQPMEPNYANPADPLQRQMEDERTLDARGRSEAPVRTLPALDTQPPDEEPDPDDEDGS